MVIATHGRGIIIIDDITPLRQISSDILTKDLHFFDRKPTILSDKAPFFEGGDAGQFVGNNPNKDAKIIYYLKSRHTFGKMTVEIFDEAGKKMIDLNPGKAKGINIVDWDGYMLPPKIGKAKTVSQAMFFAPRAPVGTYNVKITKGDKVYENKLVLAKDPQSIHTEADRKIAYETTMKLFELNEGLAYSVDQLDLMIDSTTKYITKAPKLKKDLEPILKQLIELKERMVVTTGDNYIETPEPRLREKLGELYMQVAGYFGKPSSAQFANMAVLEKEIMETKAIMEEIKSVKFAKLTPKLLKNKLSELKFRSFDEFKKAK